MVSHITVAQKNHVPVRDVHERAIALNQTYFLNVFKSADDNLWHGGVWKKENCSTCRKDECKQCVQCVLVLDEGFTKPQYAACHLNRSLDAAHLTKEMEKKVGLTNEDLTLLTKLEVRPSQRETAQAFQIQQRGRTLY